MMLVGVCQAYTGSGVGLRPFAGSGVGLRPFAGSGVGLRDTNHRSM